MKSRRAARSPVAFGKRGATWENFQAHVAGACEQLTAQPGGRWLLCSESSYAFGVGLFALWQTGRVVVLPPNQQPESLREASKGINGILTDASAGGSRLPVISPLAVTAASRRWKTLNPSRVCLELFTSGSTGERHAVKKTLTHLQSEIAVLEKTFGRRMGSCRVDSTVSHQHIYGLLFRLLWPLCAGRPFADDTVLLWEDLATRLDRSVCLISTPSHLERFQNTHPRLIFSSGGPLRASAVQLIQEHGGRAPIEVFGSTETGGVAWRQRDRAASENWRPLPGVTVETKKDGRFQVRSPFVSAPKGVFLMGDRGVVFDDGTFRLEGRVDRIVKLAEKRLSLDDMERRLARHPWVAEAKIILLDSQDERRAALGAVIVLNSRGRSQRKTARRAALAAAFRTHLRKSFDGSTLPRLFRFVNALPRDAQGKCSRTSLASIFETRFDPSLKTPERLKEVKGNSRLRLRLRVPEKLAYLEGHFPELPIVPGIVQLRWVVDAAARWLNAPITVQRMEAVKFKNLLLPGRTFWLVVEKDASTLRFSLAEKETLYSSGRLILS